MVGPVRELALLAAVLFFCPATKRERVSVNEGTGKKREKGNANHRGATHTSEARVLGPAHSACPRGRNIAWFAFLRALALVGLAVSFVVCPVGLLAIDTAVRDVGPTGGTVEGSHGSTHPASHTVRSFLLAHNRDAGACWLEGDVADNPELGQILPFDFPNDILVLQSLNWLTIHMRDFVIHLDPQ